MLFNSIPYLAFLLPLVAVYWLLPIKVRWWWLLLASVTFYFLCSPDYVLLFAFSALVNYVLGHTLLSHERDERQHLGIVLALCYNIGMLFLFKVWHEFEILRILSDKDYGQPWAFPVGLSFYTFQAMSYLFDIRHGKVKAENHFGKFALYLSFFPIVLSGPIERAKNLLPQLIQGVQRLLWNGFMTGISLFGWGLFKKVVVADNLNTWLQPILTQQNIDGSHWLLAAWLYPIQLYSDFSGYTDMARGSAALLGIRLSENFRSPLLSFSFTDFWRRWHISLTSWFTDYLFTPLTIAWRDFGKFAVPISIMLTFLISGLWHALNLNLILWGFVNGLILVIEYYVLPRKDQPAGFALWMRRLVNYQLIAGSFLLLFTQNLDQFFTAIDAILTLHTDVLLQILSIMKSSHIAIGLAFYLILQLLFLPDQKSISDLRYTRSFAWGVLLILSLTLLGDEQNFPFIYFRF